MVQRTGKGGHGNILFVQNNFYYDAFFLKAIGTPYIRITSFVLTTDAVLNGACDNGWCYSSNGSERYQVSSLPFLRKPSSNIIVTSHLA
jgi:integrin alpha FG-GAP repeat containing protein 1